MEAESPRGGLHILKKLRSEDDGQLAWRRMPFEVQL